MHGSVDNKELKVSDIPATLQNATDMRIFVLAKALLLGYSVEQIYGWTKIDRWFLEKLKHIIDIDQRLREFHQISELIQFMDETELLGLWRSLETISGIVDFLSKEENKGLYPNLSELAASVAVFPAITQSRAIVVVAIRRLVAKHFSRAVSLI